VRDLVERLRTLTGGYQPPGDGCRRYHLCFAELAGFDADLTIVDMSRRETITNSWIASKSGWTPYDGVTVTGWPVGTILRGQTVMWQGELVNAASGQPIEFLETLR